ncbi:EAL domain-containing protein [Lysobacter sp. TY2-98]|uniref:putative bifunctional diguanylate cyclase/phosphodiesterase n=1 Tax=Lysobacter sp. TY2-98 TaxID=2290922 RepID=UPI0013B43FA7|nr:EAL domain-containing protein [Lysobacter sp. TY2-98]
MRLDLDSPGLLSALLESMADYAVIIVDPDGRVRLWSVGAERLFLYTADEMCGHPVANLFSPDDREAGALDAAVHAALEEGRAWDIRCLVRRDGSHFWAECLLSPVRDAQGRLAGFLQVARDATARKRDEEKMMLLARMDPLTGLANRTALDEKLVDTAQAAARSRRMMVVHMIDLDHFKVVNDRHGHAMGDELLRRVAQRITKVVRSTDFVARLGGDEFVLVQTDVDDPTVGGRVAAQIVEALARPFRIDRAELHIGASIGIAVFPRDSVDTKQLLRMADVALYKVKSDHRGGYHYFTEDMDRIAHRLGTDRAMLREALDCEAFTLHYQPQIDTRDGRVVGMEALLRCEHPALAGYPVHELISLAEGSGLIRDLGVWCLGEACRQARSWRDMGIPPLRMCVNFCAGELNDPNLLERVADVLERTGLTSGDVEIEITEQQLVDYSRPGDTVLDDLRSMGASLAIDDFGTGYSSLGYLAKLPVDRIKLDRSFVERVPEDAMSCTVALAIVNLAHTLDLGIVAEGVETEAQSRFLEATHCEAQQGFYFSRPLDRNVMTRWLLGQPKRSETVIARSAWAR